jgi:hypothetical protein
VSVTRPCAIVAVLLLLAGCTHPPSPAPRAASKAAPNAGCAYDVRRDVIPAWARTGFSGPSPSGYPYVLGAHGDILGVVFGYPLAAPPAADRDNKILWVSRVPVTAPATLTLTARQDGVPQPETREVAGGPGPSIIDLPRPGCWHVTLTWSGHTDTVDLRYEEATARPVLEGCPVASAVWRSPSTCSGCAGSSGTICSGCPASARSW